MQQILSLLATVVVTLLVIGFIVFIHELGHFLAAKSVGVKVEKFAIGFGPKLWRRQIGETEYSVRLIMLGGFVQMYGDLDAASTRQDESLRGDSRSYLSKKWYQKLWITLAGIAANVVLAAVLFTIYLAFVGNIIPIQKIGDYNFVGADVQPQLLTLTADFRQEGAPAGAVMTIAGQRITSRGQLIDLLQSNYNKQVEVELFTGNKTLREQITLNGDGIASNLDLDLFPTEKNPTENVGRLQLGEIEAGKPFAEGISTAKDSTTGQELKIEDVKGQLLMTFAGEQVYKGSDLQRLVDANLGKQVEVGLLDYDGKATEIQLQLPAQKPQSGGILGINYGVSNLGFNKNALVVRYPNAFVGGISHTANSIGYNAYALAYLIGDALRGKPDGLAQNVGSIITVGDQVGSIISFSAIGGAESFVQLLNLMGVFSAVLAFMNILPIPILDGGNAMFILLEALRGKPLPQKVMDVTYLIFFGLLILLSVVVIGLDIFKLAR